MLFEAVILLSCCLLFFIVLCPLIASNSVLCPRIMLFEAVNPLPCCLLLISLFYGSHCVRVLVGSSDC